MKIKVEPYLRKQGNKLAAAAVEFDDGLLAGFQLRGFTICESDDDKKELFVLFPASLDYSKPKDKRAYFFLTPGKPEDLEKLEDAILDVYDHMVSKLIVR